MDSIDGWSRDGAESDGVHSLWRHDVHDLEVRIASAEDGTWDLLLQQRLIANRDEPRQVEERARELMENLSRD
ncbi:MAG: hypothetical protein ABEJ91_01365 [Candidatus Nanohaloarchaea archaeon]